MWESFAGIICSALTGNNCTDFHVCPPDTSYTYTQHSSALRQALIGENSGYDSAVPPMSNRSSATNFATNVAKPEQYIAIGTQAGTDVGMQIVFYKVDQVDVPSGHMRVKVWLRLAWYDYRLRWNPADYGNITQTYFRSSSYTLPEDTEIWLPDVSCYNAQTGLMSSLDASLASVTNEGWVYWSRPGMLEVICRYSGLINFPADKLKCQFEMAGWWLSTAYQNLYPMGGA